MADIARMRLDTVLAEFGALRDEIAARSEAQDRLMALSATASIALAGFALDASAASRPWWLLLIPAVSALFGFLWLDHHRSIGRMGAYIKLHHRETVLRALAGAGDTRRTTDFLMRWEWEAWGGWLGSDPSLWKVLGRAQFLILALPGIAAVTGAGAAMSIGERDTTEVIAFILAAAVDLAVVGLLACFWWVRFTETPQVGPVSGRADNSPEGRWLRDRRRELETEQ